MFGKIPTFLVSRHSTLSELSLRASLFQQGPFWLWTVNSCSSYSIEIYDLYSPSSSPDSSHWFEFALQGKLGAKLAMTEKILTWRAAQRQMLSSAREPQMWV